MAEGTTSLANIIVPSVEMERSEIRGRKGFPWGTVLMGGAIITCAIVGTRSLRRERHRLEENIRKLERELILGQIRDTETVARGQFFFFVFSFPLLFVCSHKKCRIERGRERESERAT